MIEIGGRPTAGGMAGETILGNRDVIRIHAGGGNAVVTTAADPLYIGVIDPGRRCPLTCAVTSLAVIAGLHMFRMLARQRTVIVTAVTVGCNAVVIEIGR